MATSHRFLVAPRSVAIVGASDNPDKIGGRPILFLRKFGFDGPVYPVNPSRATVQGLPAFAEVEALPEVPELVYLAVAGEQALDQVRRCARLGVKAVMVISSGFGEVDEAGRALQREMVDVARAHGMRLIGPNTQGFANFGTGAVTSFCTMFLEIEPGDGPVAIVSQSGAMAQMAYGQLRQRGVGVRHIHATGNEADVSVADVAAVVLDDPDVKVLLLYMESIHDAAALREVALRAAVRGVPIIAVKSGRTAAGKQAASSHTGALANEDAVVDAFFRKFGIWRARDIREQLLCVQLYLNGWKASGKRLAIVSNSGASCVVAADNAAELGLELASLQPGTQDALRRALPGFAATGNPVDITAALLTDSGLFGKVLPVLGQDSGVDMLYVQLPVTGAAYDVQRFAEDTRRFSASTNIPVVVCAWQNATVAEFMARGIPVFDDSHDALSALAQLYRQQAAMSALRRQIEAGVDFAVEVASAGAGAALDEVDSLACVQRAGIPVVRHRRCDSADDARRFFESRPSRLVVKGCSPDFPHKSEHGLVALGLENADAVDAAFRDMDRKLASLGAGHRSVVVAEMVGGGREMMIGAHRDPVFGPVIVVGEGGKYVEQLENVVLMLPPFSRQDVLQALTTLRHYAVLRGVRGEPAADLEALADAAVAIAGHMRGEPTTLSIDINPVFVFPEGDGVVAVDALVERSTA